MDSQITTPRITSSHLSTFRGRTVRLVGRVIAVNGSSAILEASDQGQVNVTFVMSVGSIMPETIVEVLGRVESDLSVSEMSTAHFANYDPEAYTRMVNLAITHKELFGW